MRKAVSPRKRTAITPYYMSSFHAIPRDFPGDFCSISGFPLSAMLSEQRADLHMLSLIGAGQRREGSSRKSWFGTANRLHCTAYPSWARFSGSRTNFIRARTTSRHGPSTGESLLQHGRGIVVYTTNLIYPCRANFFGTRTLFIRAVPKFLDSVNGALFGFRVIFSCRTRRVVSSGEDSFILLARVAQSQRFTS